MAYHHNDQSLLPMALRKTIRRNTVWKGLVWLTHPGLQSVEGSQGRNKNRPGTRRQELKQKPWIRAACGLAQPALFKHPGQTAQRSTASRGMGTPNRYPIVNQGWALPIVNQENSPKTCLQADLVGHCSKHSLFYCHDKTSQPRQLKRWNSGLMAVEG